MEAAASQVGPTKSSEEGLGNGGVCHKRGDSRNVTCDSVPGSSLPRWPAELSSCEMVTGRAGSTPLSGACRCCRGRPVVLLDTCCLWVSPGRSLMQTSVPGVAGLVLGWGCITGVRGA